VNRAPDPRARPGGRRPPGGDAPEGLGARLRDLYVQGSEGSTLEVILGATSLDDLLSRIDTVNRVSDQDTQVLREVRSFRREVQRRNGVLRRANAEQRQVVAERAATKRQIESGLAERQRMLSSIKSQIVKLKAEQARRQQILEAQARARLSQIREQQLAQLDDTILGAAAVTPDGPSVLPPAQYGGVVGIAMQYLGVPYVWGGMSESRQTLFGVTSRGGFDCSGFAWRIYRLQAYVGVPQLQDVLRARTASGMAGEFPQAARVRRAGLKPGDLVFFSWRGTLAKPAEVSHMGIYAGNGWFVHSSNQGTTMARLSGWYADRFAWGRRPLREAGLT